MGGGEGAGGEGIIPGTAIRRLARLVGGRLARRAILFERDTDRLTGAGIISAAANRKALQLGEESVN